MTTGLSSAGSKKNKRFPLLPIAWWRAVIFTVAVIIASSIVQTLAGKKRPTDVVREKENHSIAEYLPILPPSIKKSGYAIHSLPVDITRRLLTIHMETRSNIADGVYWIDSRRVMLLGAAAGSELGLYIWDTTTDEVSYYGKYIDVCFSEGYINAQVPSEDVKDEKGNKILVVHSGYLGREVDNWCDPRSGKGCRGFLNMSCRSITFKLKDYNFPKSAAVVLQLREGDGAIVTPVVWEWWVNQPLNSRDPQEIAFGRPLLLVNEKNKKGKPLPIRSIEEIRKATYSSYANVYTFVPQRPKQGVSLGHLTGWPVGTPQPVYLMSATGEVEEIDIPSSQDRNSIIQAQPAASGIVFQAAAGRGGAGLFLFDHKEVLTLDTGYVERFTVSPDGCNVAYGVVNNYGRAEPPEANFIVKFKVIKLCKGE